MKKQRKKEKNIRVMLDLETMSTGNNAAIVAIGAVVFNEKEITAKFDVTVNLASAVKAGLEMDAGTVMWWMNQTDEAREIFANNNGCSLVAALQMFSKWINEQIERWGQDVEIWGNGADFDNTKLANAYRVCNLKQPWDYYNNRCYRTLKNLYPQVEMKRVGVHHSAGDDAVSQALHLIEIFKVMRGVNGG